MSTAKTYQVDGTVTVNDAQLNAAVQAAAISSPDRENHLRQYKIAVADERHSREQFLSRLKHHTTILTGIAGGLAVGYFNASGLPDFLIIAVFSALFTWLCFDSVDALRRTYNHFIELLRIREEIEFKLGLRSEKAMEYGTSIWNTTKSAQGYWDAGEHIYRKPWKGPRHKEGYYARTRRVILVFGALGGLSVAVSLLCALSLLYPHLSNLWPTQ